MGQGPSQSKGWLLTRIVRCKSVVKKDDLYFGKKNFGVKGKNHTRLSHFQILPYLVIENRKLT